MRQVAGLTKDGEKLDPDGEPWAMENDDAWDTLHSLIGEARELLGEPADRPHLAPVTDEECRAACAAAVEAQAKLSAALRIQDRWSAEHGGEPVPERFGWPVNPGVEVGCNDRSCTTCYAAPAAAHPLQKEG